MGSCIGRPLRRNESDVSYARMPDSDPAVDPPPPYEAASSVSSQVQQRLMEMSDEQRFQFVRRMTLLQLLPVGTYSQSKAEKRRECPICMVDLVAGDSIRLLPCMHLYHQECIDDWLSRSFSCPTCMEDLDAILTSLDSASGESTP